MPCESGSLNGGLPKLAVIAWAPYNRRSELLAKQLGADLHLIHYLRYRSPRYAPVKYPLQMVETWKILWQTRPDVVIAQNPPFLCGLMVYLYGQGQPVRYVLDWHSAAFGRAWDWAASVQRFLARRAAVNIVTNEHWRSLIASWGAEAVILIDIPADFLTVQSYPVHGDFTVAMVSTFAPDEPLDVVMEAAAGLPDVQFYITGDKRRKPASFFEGIPSNVTFTGFIPDEEYIDLLRSVDAVMSLTTRDHTMQRGGCEAVWLGRPLIISDWPLLKETFHRGSIHVPNTAEGIRAGVLAARTRRDELAREMHQLQTERRQLWDDFARRFRQLGESDEELFSR
jgi:glycosyltransferase involved in cell wall biosynthesis